MSRPSNRLQWGIPDQNINPWYDDFVSMVNQIDASVSGTVEDRNLIITGGGTITYSSLSLSWTGDIEISPSSTGFRSTIPAGTFPVGVGAGTMWMVDLVRNPQTDLVLTSYIGTKVNSKDNTFILATFDGINMRLRSSLIVPPAPPTPPTPVFNTNCLLHFEDVAPNIKDSSFANHSPMSLNGSSISSAEHKFGTQSLLLGGANQNIGTWSSEDWCFGTNDFTIDFWINFISYPVDGYADMVRITPEIGKRRALWTAHFQREL